MKYVAFCDSAGGTGTDSFTLAISHRDLNGETWLDLVRERKPRFVPAAVIAEFAQLLKSYCITEIHSDGFAGGFHSSEWTRNGITFKAAENTTSEAYLHLLPMLMSGRAHLIDNATCRNQLTGLERSVWPNGREQVTHARHASAHDDVAASVAGALVVVGNDPVARYWFYHDLAFPLPGQGNAREKAAREAREANEQHQRELLEKFGMPCVGIGLEQ